MKIRILTYCLLLLIYNTSPLIGQYDGDIIFDESYIHEVRINTEASIDELYTTFLGEYLQSEYSYAMADLVIDGNTIDSIGVRVKGGISAIDPKKPFKIDFNEFVKGKNYDGIKKLNLHQGNLDASFMRESIAYGLMRNAGVKTVRTSFAEVYFNDEYQGMYTIVEQIDKTFIHNNFASKEGTLYKTGASGLDTKYTIDSSFTYDEFKSRIEAIPDHLLHEQLSTYLDEESFLRFFSTHIFINGVDGPLTADYNYYIYYEPKSKKYVYVPWDYNLCLLSSQYSIFPNSINFIFEKLKKNNTLRERFLTTFCQLLSYNFDKQTIFDQVEAYRALLKDKVPNDPFIEQIGDFNEGVSILKNIISSRYDMITTEMNTQYAPCAPVVNPINMGDVVINELVASNTSESGISDPAGGSSDWIELFNNTTNDISLNDCYLSNDRDFLKHWRFPKNAILPSKSYMIIWADRDLDEEGVHTDFKLNKKRGDLYLSYENGEIIDSVSFSDQCTNVSYARVPNGVGHFIKQKSTFSASNDSTSSIQDLHKLKYKFYPNPMHDILTLEFYSSYNEFQVIEIHNINGKAIYQTEIQAHVGTNVLEIPIDQIPSGVYLICMYNPSNRASTMRQWVIKE